MSFLRTGVKEKLKIGKKKTKYKYITVIEWFLLLSIILTSVNITYVTVPIFLTVVFLLLQVKKYMFHRINKEELEVTSDKDE